MKDSIKFVIVSLMLLGFSNCSQKDYNQKGDRYTQFISEMQSRGFNTGNILVYENGKLVVESTHGLRSIHPKDSLTLESQFRIASISKQFTAVAIMKLKQQGELDYDQKVNTILTDFPYDEITIRQLLNHTSGLGDDEALIDEHYVLEHSIERPIIGNREILEVLYKVKPELYFQPGEGWEYSNMGYTILASIIEKVSKQHLRDFLEQHIFEPLGMTSTTLYKYQEGEDNSMPNRVFGYSKSLNQTDLILDDYHLINDVRGSGGIYSTLGDLFKWNMALINYEVLPKEYMCEAWARGSLNNGEKVRYGFGWKLPKDKTKPKAVFHAGGWAGFGTYLYNEIETKSGYVVLTNDSWESFIAITDGLDSISMGAPYVLQKRSIGKDILKHLFSKDLDHAIQFYNEHKSDSNIYSIDVYELNNVGYDLLENNYIDEALKIFELNINEYPSVAGIYDSYGDALIAKGDTLRALDNFKIAYQKDKSLSFLEEKILSFESILK